MLLCFFVMDVRAASAAFRSCHTVVIATTLCAWQIKSINQSNQTINNTCPQTTAGNVRCSNSMQSTQRTQWQTKFYRKRMWWLWQWRQRILSDMPGTPSMNLRQILSCILLMRKMHRRARTKHRFRIRDTFRMLKDRGKYNLFIEIYDHDHESFHYYFAAIVHVTNSSDSQWSVLA